MSVNKFKFAAVLGERQLSEAVWSYFQVNFVKSNYGIWVLGLHIVSVKLFWYPLVNRALFVWSENRYDVVSVLFDNTKMGVVQ